MNASALNRARGFRGAPFDRAPLYAVGICSALVAPLLVLVLGLLVQLKVERNGLGRAPEDWSLGPVLNGRMLGLPWFPDADLCALSLLGVAAALAVLEPLLLAFYQRMVTRAAVAAVARLKHAVYAQALRIGAGDLMGGIRWRPEELFTDKTELVRVALGAWWRAVPRAVVSLALLILVALLVDFWVALLAVLMAGFIWRIQSRLLQWSVERARNADDQASERHELLLEDLHLAPLASGFALEKTLAEPFAKGLRQYEQAAARAEANRATVGPLLVLGALVAAFGLAFTVSLADGKSPAGIVTLVTALAAAYFPAALLFRLPPVLAVGEEAAAEIFSYLDREPMIHASSVAKPIDRLTSAIELDRVTIADRDGKKLLSEVSLAIPAGGRVGLVASDSQTPLVLAGLLVRFYDPAAGRILFDANDIRHATLDSLQGQAAFIGGRSLLFTGPVSDNITCGGTGYTTPQITDAAKLAGAYDFVQNLPQGFSTVIGEHGARLDRSEALRIALARAMLREPSLLIVEEPPEPAGGVGADHLDKSLQSVAVNRTLIVLPHRLNTLRWLDRIFLFHQGKLVASGMHAELLQTSDLYRHLNYVRFNPFRDGTTEA